MLNMVWYYKILIKINQMAVLYFIKFKGTDGLVYYKIGYVELTKAHPDPISATKNRLKNASSGPAYYRELEILHTWIDREYRVREIEARVLDTFLPWRRKAFDGTVGKTETWAEFVYPPSAINKQKSSFPFYAFIEATTKQVAVVRAAPISGYL